MITDKQKQNFIKKLVNEVEAIRSSDLTLKELSNRYRVSTATISRIKNNKLWSKHYE